MVPGTVYLLHFDRPFRGKQQHYLGWTRDLAQRLAGHRSGAGSRTTALAHAQGIGFVLARTWPGGQDLERELKHQTLSRVCPVCMPSHSSPSPR